jgi:GTPase SAR1 family protein
MPSPTPNDDALRIVLFGMPDAGKTSLLGGLAQASQTQEHVLNGHLTDPSNRLAELQHRVYDEGPRETLEEVVPYPVTLEPFTAAKSAAPAERLDAVLVDCDGRVANELLSRRRSLESDDENTLAGQILDADALVLVVDASAGAAQIESDFGEFRKFLRLLEESRGRRSEVGGLPVFLVLTKCDLLAQPGDTAAAWVERVEERKRQVDRRFHEFLEEDEDESVPFGSIDLHLWATAVKRPVLADAAAKPREPYGIAELFRQLFSGAEVFRERCQRSGRRLAWTVGAACTVFAGLVGLTATLLAHRDVDRPSPLLNKVESYRSREGQTPSARLREPLQPRIAELTDLKNDPEFASLPPKEQEYVASRLDELKEYRAYKERLQEVRPPAEVANERELDKAETILRELTPPPERQAEWGQTEAALLRSQRLEDVKAIRAAVNDLDDWYRRVQRRGEELWTFAEHRGGPIPWRDWQAQVQKLLDEADTPLHVPTERLPHANRVTYATVLRFDRITEDRRVWDGLKQRLQRLRDLSAALGLAGSVTGRPPVLEIPAQFPATRAAERVQELERAYPRFAQDFTLTDLPEIAVGEIRQAARGSYENVRDAGRAVVLRRLRDACPEGKETLECWRRLRPWLANPEELQAWRRLANLLLRLHNPDAGDPITALDAFVSQDQFNLEFRYLTLELPDDLKLRPAGRLAVNHRSGEAQTTLAFEVYRDGRRDPRRRVTTYTFQPTGGTALAFRPGDRFWAELPLKDEQNGEWLLTWSANRSRLWEFERLSRDPWLRRKDQEAGAGKFAEGVRLTVEPESGVPVVPDVVPIVPAKFGE